MVCYYMIVFLYLQKTQDLFYDQFGRDYHSSQDQATQIVTLEKFSLCAIIDYKQYIVVGGEKNSKQTE